MPIFASGTSRCSSPADRENRFDAIVDEVDLPAARQLVANGTLDDRCVELDHVGLDRQPVLGRRFDHGHVADADERHVQGARDGRGGQRQYIHLLPHLLDAFLVGDAEPLFLVHDQQAEVLECHVLRQQPVGPDQDVELAFRHFVERLLDLLRRPEAADHVDCHGEARETLDQRLLVLKGQHRRRREHRHLLAVHDRLERGAHRHLGLAVADVAAEQAVHRRGGFHVPFDVGDGRGLIRRQLVGERPSNSSCQCVSGEKAKPATALRCA
jgi:hypothetical protein